VIRLLREHLAPPFTNTEREDLQHFADLLGLAMLSAWRWILTEHILDAETEAICITRNDIEKDSSRYAVPRVVYCDPGAEALFGEIDRKLRGVDARELYAKGEYDTIRGALNDALDKSQTSPFSGEHRSSSGRDFLSASPQPLRGPISVLHDCCHP
jgi:hypothetical protein